MAISGTYYLKKWIPNAELVHTDELPRPKRTDEPPRPEPPKVELKHYGVPGENFFEGDVTFVFAPQPDGSLRGTANGEPIVSGYYTGDEFFTVEYKAGPGQWHITARVDPEGFVEGIVTVGNLKGFPNLCYGRKLSI